MKKMIAKIDAHGFKAMVPEGDGKPEELELHIVGEIGTPDPEEYDGTPYCRYLDVLSALRFAKDLDIANIRCKIHSPGGSVMDGLAIYHALKSLGDKVTCEVVGCCGSIATVIACAGKLIAPKNALMIYHDPSKGGIDFARAADLRMLADQLDKMSAAIAGVYAEKTGKPMEEILAMMAAETWMTGEEAKAYGFVDELCEEMDAAACVSGIKIDGFAKVPERVTAAIASIKAKADESAKALVPESCEQTKLVPDDMLALLNRQIGRETFAANYYKAAAAFFQAKGLTGFEAYCIAQAKAELDHSMLVFSYVVEAGGAVNIPPIEAPVIDAQADPLAITRAMLDLEMSVTGDWKAISDLAAKQDNSATLQLAQKFVAEQIESESDALALHQKVKLADSGSGLLVLDANMKTPPDAGKPANVDAKAKVEAPTADSVRGEFKALVAICGTDRAGKYFEKCLSLEQAKDAYIAELKTEAGRLTAANVDLAQKLDVALQNPRVAFTPQGENGGVLDAKMEADIVELAKCTPGVDVATIRARVLASRKHK